MYTMQTGTSAQLPCRLACPMETVSVVGGYPISYPRALTLLGEAGEGAAGGRNADCGLGASMRQLVFARRVFPDAMDRVLEARAGLEDVLAQRSRLRMQAEDPLESIFSATGDRAFIDTDILHGVRMRMSQPQASARPKCQHCPACRGAW